MKPKIIVFASGTPEGGGSGFENLVAHARLPGGDLDAEIVAVVSNHRAGGVASRAARLGIPFVHMSAPYDAESYRAIVRASGARWVALSGWLKFVRGLDPRHTFNIHPALLSFEHGRFGGKGLYGHHVHEAVQEALARGEIAESGFTMHFTTEEYDRGPIFCECRVPLERGMNADGIAKAVNAMEHRWQPFVTNLVVHEKIRLEDGMVVYPPGYEFAPPL